MRWTSRRAALLALLCTLALPKAAGALPWPGAQSKTQDLYDAIKSFKDFDTCVARLAKQLPPSISALLAESSLDIVCYAHQAVAEDDAQICQKMVKNYQRRKDCKRFYAIYTGRPNECPSRGYPRYPKGACLAMASRNPGLCRLVHPNKRATCNGVLRGETFCKTLKGADKSNCLVAARTWKRVVKPAKAKPALSYKSEFTARGTALTAGVVIPAKAATVKSTRLDQGVLVADKGGAGDWFILNYSYAPTEYYVSYRKRNPLKVEFQVPIQSGAVGTHKLTGGPGGSAKLSFSSRSPHYRHVRMNSTSGSVTISRYERKLGGAVEGTYWLVFSDGVDRVRVEGHFKTYVRHLVPLNKVAGYMRYRVKPRRRYHYNRGRLSPDELKRAKARVRKVKDNVYDVDPTLRDEVVKDTAKIRYGASISSARSQGGYKLYTVYRNSVLWQVGFRDRDIVTAINRINLDKPEDAYRAYGKLGKSRKLVFKIERGGKTVKLTLRIRRVRAKKKRSKKSKKRKKS